MSGIHLCAPAPLRRFAAVVPCPTCERLRRMSAAHYAWYGTTLTCAGCGDTWTDGVMHDRPFAPGWRQANIRRARAELALLGVPA